MNDNQVIQKDLIKKIVNDASGAVGIRLCAIGVDLGIFDDLAHNGPSTSEELSSRMNLNERYLREWALGLFSSGYLDFNKENRKISLKPEYIPVLVEEGGKFSQKGVIQLLNSTLLPYHELLDVFRNGGGINYDKIDQGFWDGIDQTGCTRYRHFLVKDWIDEMPELKSRLEKGSVTFADFGCGSGRSTIELAKKFPKSKFFGFDLFEPNIQKSQKNAEEADVSENLKFIQWDVSNKLENKFDFVACFDLIHDMIDPLEGMKNIRDAVKDDGIFVLMDIKCEDDPADNKGPMVPFMYAMSLHFCMTTSLANNGAGLGTVGLPEGKVKEYCKQVGFNKVKRIEIDHPLNAVYEIRPN